MSFMTYGKLRFLMCMSAFFLASGCVAVMPDKLHYRWEASEDAAAADLPASASPFLALAFSGGGSRAAVFAAAGAEALHARGLLADVTHISSVSGGSMAASYLAANPPEACTIGDKACSDAYFTDYQAAMRRNYFWRMEMRQLLHPNRFLSPTRRINSLKESFDRSFLNGVSFEDLPDGRVFLINAASYDDARRFVFSNRPLPPVTAAQAMLGHPLLSARSFETGTCLSAAPGDFPLSLAVAASAAFPPALGPVTIEVAPECGVESAQYWHLGDGGILENTGIETVHEVLLREVHQGAKPSHAIIFSFDAGKREDPEANLANSDLRLWTTNPGRIVDIANMRANSYREIVWNDIRADLEFPVRVMTIRYTDNIPDSWPASCSPSKRRSHDIGAHLSKVPTRFGISPCDADLIAASARKGVFEAIDQHREEIKSFGNMENAR